DDQRDLDALRAGIGVLIHERRLDIATQPIFDLRGGSCIGVEALARFPQGWGAPDATFRAADAAGLGVELERLAVQQAWPILERLRPRQFLTVNLSPVAAAALAERATAYAVLPPLDLNASVIAEGLERPADLAALYDLGVDAAQGYLLGRPSTESSDLTAWLGDGGTKARTLGR